MCGIAGIYLKDATKKYLSTEEIENLVDVLLCGIEHRGHHSAGLAVMDADGKTFLEKADTRATNFVNWRRPLPPNPKTILLHTRFATKGTPMRLENNHPVVHDSTFITHNGHINNDDDLYKTEEIERQAEVDSSIIAALLHKYTLDDPKKALEKLRGKMAIAAFDTRFPDRLLLAKGEWSPLVMHENSHAIFWASEQKTIKDALEICMNYETQWKDFKNVYYGEMYVIENEDIDVDKWEVYRPNYVSANYVSSAKANVRVVQKSDGEVCSTEIERSWDGGYADRNKSPYYYGWNYDDEECDGCFDHFPPSHLRKLDGTNMLLCYNCEVEMLGEKSENKRNSVRNLIEGDVVDIDATEVNNDDHWAICELVAEMFKVSPEFVDYMIYESQSLLKDADDNFRAIYESLVEAYDETLEELFENFSFIEQIEESGGVQPRLVGFN